MIKIGTPFITTENERAKLHAPVTITDDTAKRYVEETDKLSNIVFLTKADYPPAHWKEDGTVPFPVLHAGARPSVRHIYKFLIGTYRYRRNIAFRSDSALRKSDMQNLRYGYSEVCFQ